MLNVRLLATRVALSIAVVGAMSVAGAGVADAAITTARPASQPIAIGSHRACARLARRETHAANVRTHYANKTARFAGLEDKAHQTGNEPRADHWQQVVTHREAVLARKDAAYAARSSNPSSHRAKLILSCS